MPSLPQFTVILVAAALNVEAAEVRADPPSARAGAEAVLERFEVAKGGMLLLLPVELKGRKLSFAIDTGASSCIFDSSLTPLLGEPLRTEPVGTSDGVARIQFFHPPDAMLGRSSLRTGSPVIATDLRRLREISGEEVYGFIGMDFLAQHVVRIDPDRGEVAFLRSAGPEPGRRLPIAFVGNLPYVRVQLAGMDEPQPFLVDTGCSPGGGTGLLQAATFDALARGGQVKLTGRTVGQSLSGVTQRQRGKVREITLADFRHADLVFSASQRNILGVNYWLRYVATFDFPAGAIYLKAAARYDQPDTQDISGLTLVRVDRRTLIDAVEESSPAALAGIRAQDVVLRVNGENAEGLSLTSVHRLLAVKGAKVVLLLSRGQEEREVPLVLREWEGHGAAAGHGGK
jgi:hypothetical protein